LRTENGHIAQNYNNGTVDYWQADILQSTDYSPGGVTLRGRNFSVFDSYKYGHEGQLSDSEIYGDGNSYAYKYRMSDPRLVRMWSVDPLSAKYPYNSSYAFSENRLIDGVELEGLEVQISAEENKLPDPFDLKPGTIVNTTDGRFLRVSEWNGGYHYNSYRDITDEYTATITAKSLNPVKTTDTEPSKFSQIMRKIDEGGSSMELDLQGVKGMYKAADNIDEIGDGASYIPTGFSQFAGGFLGGISYVLRTIADFNTLDKKDALINTGVRTAKFMVDRKVTKDIKEANFDKKKGYIYDQFKRKLLDKIENSAIKKPNNKSKDEDK